MESSMIISLIKTLIDDQSNNVKDLLNAYPSINYVDENGNEKSEIMNRYFLMLNEDVTKEKNEQLKYFPAIIMYLVFKRFNLIFIFLVLKEYGEFGRMMF